MRKKGVKADREHVWSNCESRVHGRRERDIEKHTPVVLIRYAESTQHSWALEEEQVHWW